MKASLLALLAAITSLLHADDYYLAADGDDQRDGKTPQTALKHLSAACRMIATGPHTIHVAAGIYEESEPAKLPAGVSLIGAGIGKTVFRWKTTRSLAENPMAADPDAFLIHTRDSAHARISGISIDGHIDGGNRAHGGILAQQVQSFAIRDCEFKGLEFCGVWLDGASNSSIHHCQFDDCAHPDSRSCSGALQIGELTDCTIHNNLIREHRGAYGIKTWRGCYRQANDWSFFQQHKVRLVRVKFYGNDIKTRQSGAWGNGQPNMNLELWNSDPVDCEIFHNRFNECVSLVEGADAPRTVRVHHNLFLLEPGYSYAIEAGHHHLEIDHNVFRHGCYPIASWSGIVRDLHVHHNTFDGVESVAVMLMPGLQNFQFTHNTVVVKQELPFLGLGKMATESANLRIEKNLFAKDGGAPLQASLIPANLPVNRGLVVSNNAYWNWKPSGDQSLTLDAPPLQRSTQGDQLLLLPATSKLRSQGIGDPALDSPLTGKGAPVKP